MKITPTKIIDSIKSNWYVWECEVELDDGTIKIGIVQADYSGEIVAEWSLEYN